jgi:hypothetical protein
MRSKGEVKGQARNEGRTDDPFGIKMQPDAAC